MTKALAPRMQLEPSEELKPAIERLRVARRALRRKGLAFDGLEYTEAREAARALAEAVRQWQPES